MNMMNLGATSQGWSDDTVQCLSSLKLLFSTLGELSELAGLPGGKATYSGICDMLSVVSCGGPQTLEAMVSEKCVRVSQLTQSRNIHTF